MPVPPAVRRAEFRRATGTLEPPRPFHGGTGPLAPLPFRADVEEELPPEEGRLGQALILVDMGDYAGASVLCHAALEEDPFRPAAHFLLGLARRLQGSYQEAVHQFRAAAYLQPDDWLAPFHLAESYRSLGRHNEAIREYKSCIARMDAGGPEPAPALLGGFAIEYFRRASQRQIDRLEAVT
jgi:tetratricopeptide (TPR) repeat protein